MFRSCQKNAVIKKLLRLAHADLIGGGDGDAASESRRARSAAAAKRLIRRLSVAELEALLRAVEQGGRGETCAGGRCVSSTASSRSRSQQPPSLVAATLRLFRWPDLGDDEALRRLPMCGGGGGDDDGEEAGSGRGRCCNPYHWSRVGKSTLILKELFRPDFTGTGAWDTFKEKTRLARRTRTPPLRQAAFRARDISFE